MTESPQTQSPQATDVSVQNPIRLEVELGVPITPDMSYADLRARAEAACNSLDLLVENGLVIDGTSEDKEVAAALTQAYAADPDKTSKTVDNIKAAQLTPASLKALRSYLDEFGRAVVTHSIEVRHLVTNRLLQESDNPDPRIRIRALELLGKISDVGLFTERSEVTITHQTTDELRARLRQKLEKLVGSGSAEGAGGFDSEDKVAIGGEVIDVDAELGFDDEK